MNNLPKIIPKPNGYFIQEFGFDEEIKATPFTLFFLIKKGKIESKVQYLVDVKGQNLQELIEKTVPNSYLHFY